MSRSSSAISFGAPRASAPAAPANPSYQNPNTHGLVYFYSTPVVCFYSALDTARGNSAGPRAAMVITASLLDSREDIRAAACRALRLVPSASVDDLLATAATKDASATVRGDALLAISFRLPLAATLWDAVIRAAQFDSAEAARTRAISMLCNDANRPPETEATLDWISQHDSAETVRRYAAESLMAIHPDVAKP